MKKIIKGKVYDTETAREVGDWWNGQEGFAKVRETLYQKKTGEFFVLGVGGAATQYAEPAGTNFFNGGARIMPYSFAEAREWAEDHLDADAYAQIFGAIAENASRMQVCYSLSAEAVETIKRRAAEQGITASAYLDKLILS